MIKFERVPPTPYDGEPLPGTINYVGDIKTRTVYASDGKSWHTEWYREVEVPDEPLSLIEMFYLSIIN